MNQFQLKREDTVVKIWFGPHKEHNRGYSWEHTFANELDAITYYKLLLASVEEHVRAIRTNAYNDGYKDGRGKKSRKTWFNGCINDKGEE